MGSVAAAAAAAHAAAAKAGFAREIGVFRHRGLQGVQAICHDVPRQITPVIGLHPDQGIRTTAQGQDGAEGQ